MVAIFLFPSKLLKLSSLFKVILNSHTWCSDCVPFYVSGCQLLSAPKAFYPNFGLLFRDFEAACSDGNKVKFRQILTKLGFCT